MEYATYSMAAQVSPFRKKLWHLRGWLEAKLLPTGVYLRRTMRRHYAFYERLAREAEAKDDWKTARELRAEA